MNIKGYVLWCLRKLVRDPLAWGVALNVVAVVALMGGCPAPWPHVMGAVGVILIAFTVIFYLVKISYGFYRTEQNDIIEHLRRNNGHQR